MRVHVVGGGPAGSIAALSALRHGHEVILSEEHSCAGLPVHCSGLFSKDGLERLKDFIDYKKLVINPIYGAMVNLAGVRLDIQRSPPVAFVCDRSELDATLAKNAENEGVNVEYDKKITGNFASNYIIGADGPFSSIARQLNFPKISKYAATLQADLSYACEDPHKVEVYLSNEKFPGFFAWVIPHSEEEAEFGVGVVLPHSVNKAWRALLKMKGVSYAGTPKGAVIPIRARPKTAVTHGKYRVCLVGDAAGQTKATTGGGVIFGGQCGMLAGKYITDPWKYEFAWKLKHGAELSFHRWVQGYLEHQSDAQLRRIGQLLQQAGAEEYLSRHGHMDRPLHMLGFPFLTHLISLPFKRVVRG